MQSNRLAHFYTRLEELTAKTDRTEAEEKEFQKVAAIVANDKEKEARKEEEKLREEKVGKFGRKDGSEFPGSDAKHNHDDKERGWEKDKHSDNRNKDKVKKDKPVDDAPAPADSPDSFANLFAPETKKAGS